MLFRSLATELMARFPKLESARVSKNFPHGISVTTQERKPAGIWCLSGKERCFYFDKNGVAFSATQFSSGFLVLNVLDYRPRELKLGSVVAESNWLINISRTRDLLAGADINISEFVILPNSFDEFYAKTAEGWRILFSNQTNVESQTNALAIFLKEKISPAQRASLQYVDLRIQDRIYYK